MASIIGNQTQFDVGRNLKHINAVVFCNFFTQTVWKLKMRENICHKQGRMLQSASINKPPDMTYNEMSNWIDEKIQRTSHDAVLCG
jgi:hypothetical protein